MTPTPLTDETFARGLRVLTKRDRDLARVIDQYGPPPMWARRPGFPTLIHIILEQQVSLASALAAFNRLEATIPVTPRNLLTLDDATLKTIGFSRQKTGYARHLAQAILDRRFSPARLESMDDESARAALIELKGIGVWTADIYLLMALRRPDVWPHGDLALAVAAHHVKQLPARPTYDELTAMSEAWRPWRAVAARVLWHHYLSQSKR
jgi:DNA-3-methyladenine glycosylase II